MRKNLIAGEGGSVYLLALCGVSVLNSIFFYIMRGRVGSFAGLSVADWVGYVVTQIAIVLVVYLFSVWRKYDIVAVSKFRPFRNVKQGLLLVPIALCSIVAFLPLSLLFQAFFSAIGFKGGVAAGNIDFSNPGVYFLALLVIAALPAIGEEFLMRGTVLPAFTTRGATFGVFVSALLFALMHFNPVQTAYQFAFGVVLAVVFLLSGSIVPCVMIHFLNNFITLTITAYIPQIDAAIADLGAYNWLTGTVSFAVGTVVLVILIYAYYRAGQPKKTNEGYRVVDNGVVFEEYSIYAYADKPAEKASKAMPVAEFFKSAFRFLASLFTKHGIAAAERELTVANLDIPYMGKRQPMFSVWLAIGFAVVYWVISLLQGLL